MGVKRRGKASFERRLEVLEAKFISGPVVLTFADGSTREIPGRGQHLLKLICHMSKQDELSPTERKEIELVCESVRAEEPGGGRLTEIMRCFHAGPVETAAPGNTPVNSPQDLQLETGEVR